MTREQLEKFAQNLRNEIEREREERNFFQLERDKLRTFWEITKNQLGSCALHIYKFLHMLTINRTNNKSILKIYVKYTIVNHIKAI